MKAKVKMGLSEAAKTALAQRWGGYDFYLIRDQHFKTASEIAERFLEVHQPQWSRWPRMYDSEFLQNLQEVRSLLLGWAEKKLNVSKTDDSIKTIEANIMFKQLVYGQETINFGSIGTNWKRKTEIAKELEQYKPWSVAHAAAILGGEDKLRQHAISIIETSGSPVDKVFFEGWWNLSETIDRPMLFPQVWGHTSGKLWLHVGDQKVFPAFFSFGLIQVMRRAKLLIQCEPESKSIDAQWRETMNSRRNLAADGGWLVFQFSYRDVLSDLNSCFETLGGYLSY